MKNDHACKFLFVAATAAVFGLLACGAPSTEEGAPEQSAPMAADSTQSDLCHLLTAAEIEDVLGSAPGDTTPGDASCEWAGPNGSGPMVNLRLASSNLMSFADFVAEFNAEFGGEEPDRDEYMPVEGVGNWAMFVAEGSILEAHVGERMLRVQTSAGTSEAATTIAEKALPRLN